MSAVYPLIPYRDMRVRNQGDGLEIYGDLGLQPQSAALSSGPVDRISASPIAGW